MKKANSHVGYSSEMGSCGHIPDSERPNGYPVMSDAVLMTQYAKGTDCQAELIQNLEDAGCKADVISNVCRLYHAGKIPDAVKILRRHRCSLMEELHKSQNRVDCLDYLVCRLEKQQNEAVKTDRRAGSQNLFSV